MEFVKVIAPLMARRRLEPPEVRASFDAILAGAWTPVQVAAFAIALRACGAESAETIAEAAQAMRAAMVPVDHDLPVVVDTCGTGGDGSQTLNLSSGAAVVVAACGIPVAKHGNRAASSRCGSADVFEAMGISIDVPPSRQNLVLREAGIAFLFAQAHHPALKHVGQARKELGTRTLFNVLGPLANPARATHQLVGVCEDPFRETMARALASLGVKRAWLVRSEDGLDEISPCAPSRVTELTAEGTLVERVVAPEDFGVKRMARPVITGTDPQTGARMLTAILEGEPHPARDAIVINAAAALHLVTGDGLEACAAAATRAIEDGRVRSTLERWREATRKVRDAK